MDNDAVLVTTMNDIPGYKIVAVYGEVFGLICRARNAFSNFGAGLRTIFGGEVAGYTQLLSDSRQQAIDRLRLAASGEGRQRGARDALRLQRDRRHHERDRGLRHGGPNREALSRTRARDGCVRAVSEQTPR